MASYEYYDLDEYKKYIVKRAQTQLLYKSNMTSSSELTAILNYLFDDAVNIVKDWRRLKTDDEFLSQKWDKQITQYILDAYRIMGDENLNSSNINGINKNYRISPEAKLKTSIPQVV